MLLKLDAFEKAYFGGDALPIVFPFWGCGGHSKYLENREMFETHTEYWPKTIWFHPVVDEYDCFDFNFDRRNPLFLVELQAMKFLVDEGKDKFFVAIPDNCSSYDALDNLRNNPNLIVDFIDQPEAVKRAANKLVDTLIESSDEMFEVVRQNCDGGSIHSWMNTWAPGKHRQMNCDLSVMISPDMYQEFVMEELERSTEWLDYNTPPKGRMLVITDAADPEEAEAIVDHVAKHSFQKVL